MVTKMELNAYVNTVKKMLRYVPGRRQIVKNLRRELEGYLEQNPGSTMEDVYRLFGTPESITGQVVSAMSQDEIEKNMKRVKIVRTLAVVTAVTVVVLFVLTMAGMVMWNYSNEPVFITEYIEHLN